MAEVAPLIAVNVALSVEDCHWIVPVLPATLNEVLLVPVHTVVGVLAEAVPPLARELTAIVAELLLTAGQTPLVTTTR